ncbi:hypothetical protein [Halopolyspora algeriensis]|nr:hypothetical protein [Halopolyspora algeriensis]
MRDSDLFAEFIKRLKSDSEVRVNDDKMFVDLFTWEEENLDPPIRLHVSPAILGLHLRKMESAGGEVFPNVEPIIGALQLFFVHIMETIATRRQGDNDLVVVGEDGPLLAVRSNDLHGGPGGIDQ